jgi:hypothetical protein
MTVAFVECNYYVLQRGKLLIYRKRFLLLLAFNFALPNLFRASQVN